MNIAPELQGGAYSRRYQTSAALFPDGIKLRVSAIGRRIAAELMHCGIKILPHWCVAHPFSVCFSVNFPSCTELVFCDSVTQFRKIWKNAVARQFLRYLRTIMLVLCCKGVLQPCQVVPNVFCWLLSVSINVPMVFVGQHQCPGGFCGLASAS